MTNEWYQSAYRRLLFDMHIADWDEHFLSEFNLDGVIEALTQTHATMVTVPANAHTGLCYYPTKIGQEHRTVAGKDLFGQLVRGFRAKGLRVIAYYCTIYVDWYPEQHPESRIVDAEGKSDKLIMLSSGNPRRFQVCCMNHPGYRAFVVGQLEELCQNYDFDGLWPDMTFWPTVCYCASCQTRYATEVGGEIPHVIDWNDPRWVRFQRKRQEWTTDFAHLITKTIRKYKPEATVSHQSQTFNGDWLLAPSVELASESDWLAADLYADRHQMAFYSKLYYHLSEKLPFEHLNCWFYPNIFEHVVPRTETHLETATFAALMNHGAMAFIDAVDPRGTINRDNYVQAGRVFEKVRHYESYFGGQMVQDVAIYFSFESQIDLAENGKNVISARYNFEPGRKGLATNLGVNAAKILLDNHIPFGVITKKNLAQLADYQIVLLPNAIMLDAGEIAAFQAYVRGGGSLYASKNTSLIFADGGRQPNFMLADLFGVDYVGETDVELTYATPVSEQAALFAPFTTTHPVTIRDSQVKVNPRPDAQVLATLTLPYTDPRGSKYASMLTDPPGEATDFPSIVLNSYGAGRVIYAAASLEAWDHDTQRAVFMRLLRLLASRPFTFELQAPKSVEATVFDQPDHSRYIINLLNIQAELPNIPVEGIKLKIDLRGRQPRDLRLLPNGEVLDFSVKDGSAELILPRLDTWQMMALNYIEVADLS